MRLMTATWITLLVTALPVCAQQTPFRLVTEARHRELVSLIPRTNDPRLEKLRTDQRLVVYTDVEMPRASQFWDDNPIAGLYRSDRNLSANPSRLADGSISGGPGQEFPWRSPFGMDHTQGATTFKFFWLPPGTSVRWWKERLGRDRHESTRWTFPTGTVFGEVLCVQDPSGLERPFELRIRRKIGSSNWRPDVLRPVTKRDELDRLAPEIAGKGERLTWRLANQHPVKVINEHAVEDVLPPLSVSRVRELLARPFRSVRGVEWVDGGHAPGSRADFHIIPRNYAGAAVAVTTASCARCHDTTLQHPDDFGPPGRDWYGRVPGDNSTFSWHPFDPASVSGGTAGAVRLHPGMVAAGILRQWD